MNNSSVDIWMDFFFVAVILVYDRMFCCFASLYILFYDYVHLYMCYVFII